jgi:NADPH-dependent 2,4-dienoyl-CoA reductase/sulfur reductase-like enzyme
MVMNQLTHSPGARSRIVIVGAGYAGYHCARHLERRLPRGAAEIVIVSPRSPCRARCGALATSLVTPSALTSPTAPSPWRAPTGNGANLPGTGWC